MISKNEIIKNNLGCVEIIKQHVGKLYNDWKKSNQTLEIWLNNYLSQNNNAKTGIDITNACINDLSSYWKNKENYQQNIKQLPAYKTFIDGTTSIKHEVNKLSFYADYIIVPEESPNRIKTNIAFSEDTVFDDLYKLIPLIDFQNLICPKSTDPFIILVPQNETRKGNNALINLSLQSLFTKITGIIFKDRSSLVWYLYKKGDVSNLHLEVLYPQNIPSFDRNAVPIGQRFTEWVNKAIRFCELTNIYNYPDFKRLPYTHPVFLFIFTEQMISQALGLLENCAQYGSEIAADLHAWEMLNLNYKAIENSTSFSKESAIVTALLSPKLTWLENINEEDIIRLRNEETVTNLRSIFSSSMRRFSDMDINNIEKVTNAIELELDDAFKIFKNNFEEYQKKAQKQKIWNTSGVIVTGILGISAFFVPELAIPGGILGGTSLYSILQSSSENKKGKNNLLRTPIGVLYQAKSESK